ncbi:hypothetical protein EAL2_c11520 [Peptoclostridium acidaminophilum DSM 3953]|uniref:Uncharacterized protein n=1 Tax=Peptoclostridium acidaminophilum DSM 3953 TaxID=1286171 RepID=W8TF41_PEPAC|nr:rod shape-determining protein MreD [Peptoclostridium acidaminophilum]AHM56448.1 hypothetical protein EAL2_c11520 [Peptoclostridium acidaminophilum DSM 3953]
MGAFYATFISFAIVILENSILNNLKIFGVAPDFVLIYICICAITMDKKAASSAGIIAGLVRDMLVGPTLGVSALFMYAISELYGFISDKIFKDSRFTVFVLISFASVLYSGIKLVIFGEYLQGSIYSILLSNMVVFPLLNSAIAIPAYSFLIKFHERIKRSISFY